MEQGTKTRFDGLLKAVSDTTSIKDMMMSYEENIREVENNIIANEEEIKRAEGLKQRNIVLRENLSKLNTDLETLRGELGKRIKKLESAGIPLPLNNEQSVKAFINM